MRLPIYVKKYPSFWKYIPVFNRANGNSFYPFIFINDTAFNNLQTKYPDVRYIALLKHEEKHRERQKEQGPITHILKYFFFPVFVFMKNF